MKMQHLKSFFYTIGAFFLLFSIMGCSTQKMRITKEKESSAYYKFGLAYLSENPPKTHKAYVEFIKAVETDPSNGDAYYALGHLYFLRQEYAKAIEAFKKTLEITPDSSAAFNYMGQALEIMGRVEEAVLAYQNAMNNLQYETPQLPHWNLALLYKKGERYEMALEQLQHVRRMEPNNIAVLYEIGETYVKLGTPSLARPLYEEAAHVAPNDYRTHYWLASFYLKEGLSVEAVHAFKKVIELSPESEEAKASKKQIDSMMLQNTPTGVM